MALTAEFEAVDGLSMRQTMGKTMSGVAVVTACSGAEDVGMTISSLSSISLEPPILMISLNHNTRTGDAILASKAFAVSILGVNQEAVARQFATQGGSRFHQGTFDTTPGGIPAVGDALVQIDCDLYETHEIGDHQVFFGQVKSSRHREGTELAFKAGKFGAFHDFNHDEVPWFF